MSIPTGCKLDECNNIACSRPFHSRIHCKLMIFSSSFQTCRAEEVILHSFVHFIIYRYSLDVLSIVSHPF